jgi:hypothetical protein
MQSSDFLNASFHTVQTADLLVVASKSSMWSSHYSNNLPRLLDKKACYNNLGKEPNIRQTLARFSVILYIGCDASNNIIYLKCVSTPILQSHIKQYGHHSVAMLMEIGVVLRGVVLYEGIELYALVLQDGFKSLLHRTSRSNNIQEYYPHRSVTITRHQTGNLHIKCASYNSVPLTLAGVGVMER